MAIEIGVANVPSQMRKARHALRDRLDLELGVDAGHTGALEAVANELLGAAFETGFKEPLLLSVELFARLSSVRVYCTGDVDLRDEPFGMRERILQGLAFAWGKRRYGDGSVVLWAEVARPDRESVRSGV